MGKRDATQRALRDIMAKNKQTQSREDVTALLVGKLAEIVYDNPGIREIGMEIASDRDRAYGAMMGLMGLVVQYAERSGGLVALCEYLTTKAYDTDGTLPGLSEARW